MSAGDGGKEKIQWVKQPVPKFIQNFKERTNPKKEGNSKSRTDSDEDKERDDETPLVCVTGTITDEEAKEFLKDSFGNTAEIRLESSGKKRVHNENKEEEVGSKMEFKKPTSKESKAPEKKKSKMKKVKNTSLLSFGDEEEEE